MQELKFFPNQKTQLNFNEFQELFNKGVAKNTKDTEDMLLRAFKVFDFDT